MSKAAHRIKTSIAVLPFANRSASGENEFFCDGITEEIINALANVQQLKVTSRTSSFFFKNHQSPIPIIGEQLQVATILEGSVRVSGTMLRITAQLIDVESDFHFWSETWDRKLENIFEIQDEISLLIADKLREQFGHFEINEHLVEAPTQSLDAYELLLKGKHLFTKWNPEHAHKAIDLFEQAIARDPQLLDAHIGLADAYGFLATAGFAPREASWNKALESMRAVEKMNPNHAALNYQLANYAFFTEANFSKAFTYALKSIASKPNYLEAQQFTAFLYLLKKDIAKAKEHLQYARAMDPLNHETLFYEVYYFYRTEEYSKALDIAKQLLEANPQNLPVLLVNWYCLLQVGDYDRVLDGLANTPQELIMPDERLGMNALAYTMKGEMALATPFTAKLLSRSKENASFQADAYVFLILAQQSKLDEAFSVVDKLFTHQSSILLLNYHDPLAKNLRNDSRFEHYANRIYPALAAEPPAEKSHTYQLDDEKAAMYENKLLDFIHHELSYLDPSLSLRSLARQLEIHPSQLSWLLNEKVGKNFNEFINNYRIAHFKKLAIDPANGHISLLGLAFESGFNSKTVFNTYFKKVEGITPSAFLKQQS